MPEAAPIPRFCAMCGARLTEGAAFCSACGAAVWRPLTVAPSPWRLTTGGVGLAGFLLVAGLGIWAAILSPSPPPPRPGGPGRVATPGPGAPSAGPTELPAEVRTFIDDLSARARATPDDLATWTRLGMVYYRAAQIDPGYQAQALAAFDHILARDPANLEALKGKANVFYDRNDHAQAIPLYERVLAKTPDDPSVLTDLATMRMAAGDAKRAIEGYEAVIARHPEFLQAHYNLAVTHAQLGHKQLALDRFAVARRLAPDERTRKQIDEMIVHLGGTPEALAPAADGDRSPFQAAVERVFRGAPILGERLVRFEWSGPGIGRAVVRDFPMAAMPEDIRDRFAKRLADEIRAAAGSSAPAGPVRIEIADAAAGTVMATVSP